MVELVVVGLMHPYFWFLEPNLHNHPSFWEFAYTSFRAKPWKLMVIDEIIATLWVMIILWCTYDHYYLLYVFCVTFSRFISGPLSLQILSCLISMNLSLISSSLMDEYKLVVHKWTTLDNNQPECGSQKSYSKEHPPILGDALWQLRFCVSFSHSQKYGFIRWEKSPYTMVLSYSHSIVCDFNLIIKRFQNWIHDWIESSSIR